jgi:hypothetical protein
VKDWWHFRQRPRAPTTPDPAGPPPTELGPGPGPSPEPEAA